MDCFANSNNVAGNASWQSLQFDSLSRTVNCGRSLGLGFAKQPEIAMPRLDTPAHNHGGGCLCGAVRYHVTGPLREVVYCHCSQCRRQSGLYFAATAAAKTDLHLDQSDSLRWYAASDYALRGFCGTCGSVLFWKAHDGAHIAILAGSLDDPSTLTAGFHICTEGRPTFYALCDGLPQYPHDAPGLAIA